MLWVKALHSVFVVTWFAGLFYLPRLFVYHALSADAVSREGFKLMERKLFWGIMTPSALLAYHLWCGRLMLEFRTDRNTKSHVWSRWFNEFPVVVLFAAVFLVLFKPT
jgi:putative membrane protein